MSWSQFFPGTRWISIGDGIEYRLHKHWGMGVYAGEGLSIHQGDRSGCLRNDGSTSRPIVVCQRIYQKGEQQLSAVLSYPNGVGVEDHYFWELYPVDGDVERFMTEEALEAKVRTILLSETPRDA